MGRRLVLALAALALLSPVQPALAQDPGAVDSLLALINGARATNGLPPYTLNPLLAGAAQAHSEDMASRAADFLARGESIAGAITHQGSDGSFAADRVAATGYQAIQVGEDIYATTQGPEAAFNWWMGSTLHRNNILHERFREIGIGVAPGPEGSVMYTLVFAHSEQSPALPAPTIPPSAPPPPPLPSDTPLPTQTGTPVPTVTPRPTSTPARIQLPPAASPTPSVGEMPGDDVPPKLFALRVWPWVILLELAAAAVIAYTIYKLRR